AKRCAHGRNGLPSERFRCILNGLFLGAAPGVVSGQMVSATISAVLFSEERRNRDAGLVSVEEMAEAVTALVLPGGIVGVREPSHVDNAFFLAQALSSDCNAGRDAAAHHDDLIALDHAARTLAGCVSIGLSVAGYVLDLLAQDAVAFERPRLHRVQHSAVALTIDVLDGELVALELI